MEQNLSTMSKTELKERLDKLRAARRASYAPPQKRKAKVDPLFANLSAEVAEKILAELVADLPDVEGD